MRSKMTVDAVLRSIVVHPALPEVVQRAFAAIPVADTDAVDGGSPGDR